MKVRELVAYCGLSCQSCPIFLATREGDRKKQQRMRAAISRLARKHYGLALGPEDIGDCDGCRTEHGMLFSGCITCAIRNCARQRNVESCAHCPDYACEKLQKFFLTDPNAKTRLEVIKSKI
jgi:hypothetical protein